MDQQQQLRHHRRQYSAPTDIEATNIPQSPVTHRQAGSFQDASLLTQPMEQLRQYLRDDEKVDITNQGQTQQHYLQVAQQHCQVRPGQQQGQGSQVQISEQQFRTLQHLKLEAELDSLLHPSSFSPQLSSQHFVKVERSRSNPEAGNGNVATHQSHDQVMLLNPDGTIFPLEQAFTQDTTALSADWSMTLQRPFTPPHQGDHGYFPITPTDTPYGVQRISCEPLRQELSFNPTATIRPGKSLLNTPVHIRSEFFEPNIRAAETEPDETIRPIKKQRSQQKLFHQSDVDFDSQALPSPPRTVPMRSSRHFDVALMPNSLMEDIPKLSHKSSDHSVDLFDAHKSPKGSPVLKPIPESPYSSCGKTASDVVLAIREQQSSQEHSPVSETRTSVEYGAWDLPVRTPKSPQSMLVGDLSLDATIEDTGISAEEVQSYMSEQDTLTGKWTCIYPECGKLFGRKENIRSHIQTHLNDRQFKCVHCNKRFVRQHDLKRHAKIHSGVKPFPCRCGNSFARHDALTRHRQRGICDGGFAGIVKKVAKRGRPRKERPDDDERADKSSRTRKRGTEKSEYASSVSGTSETSSQESPRVDHNGMDVSIMPPRATSSPLMHSPEEQPLSFPPSAFSYTPPMSPYSTGAVPSPGKTLSVDHALTPSSLALDDEHGHGNGSDGSDMVLVEGLRDSPFVSQPGSPPELSHSSPPSSTTRLHDMDFSAVFHGVDMGDLRNETDFDMFAAQLNDAGSFGSSWNPNTYFDLDKDLKGFTPDFDDEALFAD